MTDNDGAVIMALRLYDTGSRSKRRVEYQGDALTIYACGITPYSDSHIGHARQAIAFDILVRWLRSQNVPVKYVTNFTDVSDTIIEAAEKEGVDYTVISDRYITGYRKSMKRLNVLDADAYPRVTESIDGIISMITTLVEKGHAYQGDDGVYFEIETAPEKYGYLTGQTLEMVKSGAGGRVDDTGIGKRDHRDFALWKFEKSDGPSWESPWGRGRPGWHIECSAMVYEHFGERVDIHGGGSDLMFPHHEAEIFQSECCFGIAPFASHWMHNGMINVDGEKMSKSLGNFWTITDAIDAVGEIVLRYSLINAPYRQPIDFNEALLKDAELNYRKLLNCILNAGGMTDGTSWEKYEKLLISEEAFVSGMNDDLNTIVAIAETQVVVKLMGQSLREQNRGLTDACIGWLAKYAGKVLGIIPSEKEISLMMDDRAKKRSNIEKEVDDLIEQRRVARSEKNWTEADRIRDVIEKMGVSLQDDDNGTHWQITGD